MKGWSEGAGRDGLISLLEGEVRSHGPKNIGLARDPLHMCPLVSTQGQYNAY